MTILDSHVSRAIRRGGNRPAGRLVSTLALCGALALGTLGLTGCPEDGSTTAGAPGRASADATAPATRPQQPAPQSQAQAQADQQARDLTAAQGRQRRVQEVISRAESAYRSGVNNYNSNRLEAARLDFDASVDAILSCGIDVKSEPQLSDELDHLISVINSLELVALKQGNGFSPKVEPTPLEVAEAEVTFKSDPALVGQIAAELKTTKSDLPLVVNDYVAGYIRYYSSSPAGHAHLKRSLERAGKYKEMIQRDLAQVGVPQDLIYLAVAESGFQPQVVNRSSGAAGMWQFMPFAGAYGLERNGYFDERLDPEKSSLAYARYMKYLYNQLGDWYLAMAAYDWGPGNVQRAVQRTGYADYWELYRRNALPGETRNYVPAIIAAAIMAKNPQQYGLTDIVPDAAVKFDTVTTSYAISLNLVADVTDSSVPEIVALNPAMLRLSTPPDRNYDLHIPKGTKDLYINRLKDIPESNRGSWRFHVVRTGETLESISSSLHASAATVAQLNDVTSTEPIENGDELVVPVTPSGGGYNGQQRYTLRRGDTLVSVADRFGVSVSDLEEWNHVSGIRVTPGRSIYIAEPVHLAPSASGRRRGRFSRGSRAAGGGSSRRGPAGRAAAATGGRSASTRSSGGRAGSRASSRAAAPAAKKPSGGRRRR